MIPDNQEPIIGTPSLSEDELNRRQEEANALANQVQVDKGNITGIEILPDSDYLVYTTDAGAKVPVHRVDVLKRVKAVMEMIDNETQSADKNQVDKWIWMVLISFKAAVKSGRERGMRYDSPSVKKFEQRLLHMEKEWRTRADLRADR